MEKEKYGYKKYYLKKWIQTCSTLIIESSVWITPITNKRDRIKHLFIIFTVLIALRKKIFKEGNLDGIGYQIFYIPKGEIIRFISPTISNRKEGVRRDNLGWGVM